MSAPPNLPRSNDDLEPETTPNLHALRRADPAGYHGAMAAHRAATLPAEVVVDSIDETTDAASDVVVDGSAEGSDVALAELVERAAPEDDPEVGDAGDDDPQDPA